ncbi:CTB family bacteriocin [Pelatocladus sp. BLCC-F211]|uniref:CTB family bacteriocin n=1 Tax=Pelatocladus sp. BLCC-F211 TaxID=3342752 RepID=UPI0035B80B78
MSNEINKATELSEQELDVVAGGAIDSQEAAFFQANQYSLDSALVVGPNGTLSATSADELNVASAAFKNVKVGQ